MCDGGTLDDVLFNIHGQIERRGWAIVPVEGAGDAPSWAYTIGLSAKYDHPEFVIVGVDGDDDVLFLDSLAGRVVRGERFEPGPALACEHGSKMELLEVDPQQFETTAFAMWVEYHGALGPPYPDAHALQVVLPPEHGGNPSPPRLDTPEVVVGRLPNRTTRRAQQKRRRRQR